MDKVFELLTTIPAATLFAALVLAASIAWFSWTLSKYGPAIKDLNEFDRMSKLSYLADRLDGGISAFGASAAKADELKKKLDEVIDLLKPLAAAERERIAESEVDDRADPPGGVQSPKGVSPTADIGKRQATMNEAWNGFVLAFKKRIDRTSIAWDGRSIGAMAYLLTDGRYRGYKISPELAQEIADVYGRYRGYLRRDQKERWLTQEICDEFVASVASLNQQIQNAQP